MSITYDVIIVGAGLAGLSAALHAKQSGLHTLVLEKGVLANTIVDYHRGKYVMEEPAVIPVRSDLPFHAGSREAVLEMWEHIVAKSDIEIRRPGKNGASSGVGTCCTNAPCCSRSWNGRWFRCKTASILRQIRLEPIQRARNGCTFEILSYILRWMGLFSCTENRGWIGRFGNPSWRRSNELHVSPGNTQPAEFS